MLLSQSWSLPYTTSTYEPLSPCCPDPLRAAMGVAPDAGLSWQANYNSSSTALYQVYLGTSSDALTYIGDGTWVNGTTYSYATNLEPFTEYWWRVKAIDGATQIWSGMWSFTTGDLIQNPQIQLTPSAFYETLDVGESSVQYLSIENTGDANLEYSIGIDYSYRTEETLYPNLDSGSISNMQRNGGVDPNPRLGKKITQYPDREGETFNVLVMEEIADHAYYSLALNNLGIPHTFVNNWNLLQQEMDSTQSWDLIVVNSYSSPPTQQLLDDLAAFVAAGGQLIFADWAIGELYTHALLQDLGIGFISSYTQPKPFTATLASHPIFNTPNQIQELLVTNDQANIDGQVVSVLPSATALAEFSVDPYSSAIVLGANGSSIFNAFQADNFKGDHDEDGKLDILELLENQIVYLLGDYQQAWLSVSPTIGTVEPGTSEMIEIAFDASNISAGVHNSNLIVSSNDPSSAQIIVPVELEVMNIAEAMIEVYPEYIEHSLLQDSTDQVELEITNIGNAALNWAATVVEVRREASTPVASRPRVTAELRPERDSRPGMERIELPKREESERESSLLRTRTVMLSLDPDNGMVEAESSIFCWLNIDSSGSLSGTYEYNIVISSDAVNEPELIIPVSITVSGTPAYIPDNVFRTSLNSALGKPPSHQPTVEDLNSLTGWLYIDMRQIYSIEGAQHLVNVYSLSLSYLQLRDDDLYPLSNLTGLYALSISGNYISDISVLSSLVNLEYIDFSDNSISNIYPLSNMSNLRNVGLWFNNITDIEPLASLANAEYIEIGWNNIHDIRPLANLGNLRSLRINDNNISDIKPLIQLSDLLSLDFENNPISYESMLLSQSWSLPWSTGTYEPLSPCYPDPQRETMDVAPDAGLSWQANYNSSSTALYQVYLGTSSDALTYIGEGTWVNGTTYSYATNLEPFTEYWWRVKAIDGASEIWSGMWSFTTGAYSEFAGGDGSESDPYQVATAEHLNNVRNHLDAHFIQAADIDLGVSPWNDGDGWQPIGSDAERFSGVYFGNDYSINQMSISRPSESNLGLFGVLDGAMIHNLHVSASDVTGINWCGIISGRAYNSDFFNCHAEGSVTGTGGSIGGLMGRMDNSSLYYSSFGGTVSSSGAPVGGLIGRLDASEIGACWAIADVSGGSIVGGLAGYTLANSTIYESYSSGSASSSGDYVGGITGSAAYTISITSCYSHSAVSGNSYVGGLIGETDGATLSGCYSTGTVEGNSNTGGLVGFNTAASSAEDCYWDTDSSLLSTSVLGFGRSTAEMTYPYAMNTYNNWDFNEIWAADLDHETNSGYPYFRWYATAPDYHPPRFVQAGLDIPGARVMWYSPLVGLPSSYQVHRLIPGQESDEALWTLVADAVADTIFFDTDWESLPEGTYKWAVKARYSDQLSIAEFSDELYKELFFEPIISVNPSSVSQAMESNSFAEVPISIGNIGSGNLEWNATLTDRHRNSTVQTHLSKASGSTRVYSILFSPESGSIPAGSEYICMLSIDTSGATAGTELFELTIYSNDPVTPVYVIPISIEVLPPATNNAPIVSNVRATQRDDDSMQIDIYYDVHDADGDAMSITMEVSDDDGLSWNLSCLEILPGSDIGAGILSGTDKHIVWDAAVEHPNLLYGNNFRFRITADDGVGSIPENFVFVEGGTFHNGTSNVTLSSFYIDKYELTQAEYQAVMGVNPSAFSGYPNRPVEQVSWFNAIEYCNRRSMLEGLTPCYSYGIHGTNPDDWPTGWNTSDANHTNVSCNWAANGYRLPTEMEWMFAAKGGNQSQGYTYSGSNDINAVAWYSGNNTPYGTKDVGIKDSNELGTFDMGGNVFEWVWDIYESSYPSVAQTDPHGATSGAHRVLRGGSWYSNANYCTLLARFWDYTTRINSNYGFRLVRVTTPWRVSSPNFTPPAGSFSSAQSVEILTATAGAVIRYTLDSSEPSASYGMIYTAPIAVSASTVIKAIAYKDGYLNSDVVTAEYTIAALPPDDFVFVEGGTFIMGDTQGSGNSYELPTHSVSLNSFYIGKYEITQAEYAQYMQPSSSWTSDFGLGDDFPAYNVSWYAILKYCNLRSIAEGLTPVYSISGSTNPNDWGSVPYSDNATWDAAISNWSANGYRLPTEAEWEYSARGADITPDYLYSGSDDINAVAWYYGNASSSGSKTVGTKEPNGLGLYDMSGNIREWCWDWYGYYSSSPQINPTGPVSGSGRIIRGGDWTSSDWGCRIVGRFSATNASISNSYLGFRLCKVAP